MSTRNPRRDLTGLSYVQAQRDGLLPRSPVAETLGWRWVLVEKGRVVLAATPLRSLSGYRRTLHGGAVAMLMDAAMASAMNTTLDQGVMCQTLDLKVTFLKAVPVDLSTVLVQANVVQTRRRVGAAEARLVDEADKLYASATATFMIHAAPDPKRRDDAG